jgi:hypothetical protein
MIEIAGVLLHFSSTWQRKAAAFISQGGRPAPELWGLCVLRGHLRKTAPALAAAACFRRPFGRLLLVAPNRSWRMAPQTIAEPNSCAPFGATLGQRQKKDWREMKRTPQNEQSNFTGAVVYPKPTQPRMVSIQASPEEGRPAAAVRTRAAVQAVRAHASPQKLASAVPAGMTRWTPPQHGRLALIQLRLFSWV